jgi:hypothetical protein
MDGRSGRFDPVEETASSDWHAVSVMWYNAFPAGRVRKGSGMRRVAVEFYERSGGRCPYLKSCEKLRIFGRDEVKIRNAIKMLEDVGWDAAMEMNLVSGYQGTESKEIFKLSAYGYRISLFRVTEGNLDRIFLCEVARKTDLKTDSRVKLFVGRAEVMRRGQLDQKRQK